MRRSYLLILSILPISVLLSSCSTPPNFWEEAKPAQKRVLVSFPPLYSITHAVAGEDAYVLCMLTTQGPHGYDYGANDLFKVNKADLLIYNGLTLDDTFVDRLMDKRRNPSLVRLNIGDAFLNDKKLKKLLLKGGHEHGHEHGKDDKAHDHKDGKHGKDDGHDHKHGEYDPHLWLGPKQAIAMTRIIAAKLSAIDPARKNGFEQRADDFIKELEKLQAHGEAAFEGKHVHMVTMHESFSYFADAFDLEIVGSIQKIPGLDPDPVTRAKLVKLCKEKKVSVIAVEPQYSPAQAQSLRDTLKKSDNLDVAIVVLDPLETADMTGRKHNPDPQYYLKKMRENIDTLAKALK